MSKVKIMMMLGMASMVLGACGEPGVTEEPENELDTTEISDSADVDETEDTTAATSENEVVEAEGGKRTIIIPAVDVNETQTSGSFDVTLLKAEVSQFEPSPDFVDMFGGDKLAMVTLQVEATNNSEDTNTIYPDQGTIVTNTGNQVDADIFFSDDVGGDFLGEVTKSGDIFFFYEGNAEEIETLKYVINAPHNENFDSLGEDLEFNIEFK